MASKERQQRAITRTLERRRGPNAEARKALNKKLEAFQDWRGKCRKCGAELEGSIAQIKAHSCV